MRWGGHLETWLRVQSSPLIPKSSLPTPDQAAQTLSPCPDALLQKFVFPPPTAQRAPCRHLRFRMASGIDLHTERRIFLVYLFKIKAMDP